MLRSSVLNINELTNTDIDTMFNLMNEYYENIQKTNFVSDLSKKKQVILLKDEEKNEIKGFTSIVLYDVEIENIKIKLLFSGDTVIHKDYWSNTDLMPVWIKNALNLKKEFNEKLYWLLMSKGYKTYKYLSAFYNEFYPRYNKQTPIFEQQIINKFGEMFYPEKFDKTSGLIIMNKAKDYLKNEFSQIPKEKLTDPNIQFFANKNPEFYKGNELVCVTELAVENLNKTGRRVLGV
ncbi:hypothetical protein IJD15_01615 [bacterium]|nr:hypothetical protein [bacterium]